MNPSSIFLDSPSGSSIPSANLNRRSTKYISAGVEKRKKKSSMASTSNWEDSEAGKILVDLDVLKAAMEGRIKIPRLGDETKPMSDFIENNISAADEVFIKELQDDAASRGNLLDGSKSWTEVGFDPERKPVYNWMTEDDVSAEDKAKRLATLRELLELRRASGPKFWEEMAKRAKAKSSSIENKMSAEEKAIILAKYCKLFVDRYGTGKKDEENAMLSELMERDLSPSKMAGIKRAIKALENQVVNPLAYGPASSATRPIRLSAEERAIIRILVQDCVPR
ncbi:hypothetical protein LINGRAHAP2_LOCUS33952 [Linum grandiflorum]